MYAKISAYGSVLAVSEKTILIAEKQLCGPVSRAGGASKQAAVKKRGISAMDTPPMWVNTGFSR